MRVLLLLAACLAPAAARLAGRQPQSPKGPDWLIDKFIRKIGPDWQADISECACDCCTVVDRTHAEITVGGTDVKCGPKMPDPAEKEIAQCPAQCIAPKRVQRALKSKFTIYLNFCFLECRPYDAVKGGRCINVPEFQEKHMKSKDGQGHDAHLIPVVMDAEPEVPIAAPMELPADSEEDVMTVAGAQEGTSGDVIDESKQLLDSAADAKASQKEIQSRIDDLSVDTTEHFKTASNELASLGGSFGDMADWASGR